MSYGDVHHMAFGQMIRLLLKVTGISNAILCCHAKLNK